jgi:hypothetical protein
VTNVGTRSQIRSADRLAGKKFVFNQDAVQTVLSSGRSETDTAPEVSNVASLTEWLIVGVALGAFEVLELTVGLIRVAVDHVARGPMIPAN